MNTQIMMVNGKELTIAAYAANRSVDTMSAALQAAKCLELVKKLSERIVHGYFMKADGKTIREFIGTTYRTLAERNTAYPIGTDPKLRYGQIPFIDLENNCEWRSMRIGSFIGYAE